jgi:TatD DNase family protein
LLINSCDWQSFKDVDGFFSVGAHPWFSSYNVQIDRLAQLPNCLAIGESGLDRVKGLSFDEQLKSFEAQVQLAERIEKPLIIHCVKAFDEILRLKKKWKPNQPWIIHGYQKNSNLAKQLIDAGCYLSIGVGVKNESVKEMVKAIPTERLFLETDDSNVSIADVYDLIAKTLNISSGNLENIILRNFEIAFKKDAHKLVRESRITH